MKIVSFKVLWKDLLHFSFLGVTIANTALPPKHIPAGFTKTKQPVIKKTLYLLNLESYASTLEYRKVQLGVQKREV